MTANFNDEQVSLGRPVFVTITSTSGGNGASTLALNLADQRVWGHPRRLLADFAPHSTTDLFSLSGWPTTPAIEAVARPLAAEIASDNDQLLEHMYDLGRHNTRSPIKLVTMPDPASWVLPVIGRPSSIAAQPGPVLTRQPTQWWDAIMRKASALGLDLIIDLGPYERINARHESTIARSDVVVVLVRRAWEIDKAVSLFQGIADKTIIVLADPESVAFRGELDDKRFRSVLTMPRNRSLGNALRERLIVDTTWRNTGLRSGRKLYAGLAADIANAASSLRYSQTVSV